MPRLSSIVAISCLVCGALVSVSGCGQKGALKLPDPLQKPVADAAQVPAPPEKK
jgi:predicted small lipoprotein YifL